MKLFFQDPTTICAELKLCPASKNKLVNFRNPFICTAPRLLFSNDYICSIQIVGGAEECSICKMLVKTVDSKLESAEVKTWLKSQMLSGCSDLGSFSGTCQTYVNAYFDTAYQIVLSYLVSVYVRMALDTFRCITFLLAST